MNRNPTPIGFASMLALFLGTAMLAAAESFASCNPDKSTSVKDEQAERL